jgi:tetratricopeptide (TPR) repeat protein
MKVDAKAEIICPYYSSIRAWQDPTHLRAISENTFLYFNSGWRIANKLDHYPIISNFDYECSFILDPQWHGKDDDDLRFAIKHYMNVVLDIRVILVKRRLYDADLMTLLHQASEYWEQGMVDDAMMRCHEIVSRNGANAEIFLMLAEYSLNTSDHDAALSYFSKALEDDGASLQAHMGIVRSLTLLGCSDDVAEHLAALRTTDPELAGLIEEVVDSCI